MAHWGSRHVSVEKTLEGARKGRTIATLRRHRNLEKERNGKSLNSLIAPAGE